MPLPPRHAYNVTDGLLARLNSLFGRLMRKSRLLGPRDFYDALCKATSYEQTGTGRLISNCTPLIRHFSCSEFIYPTILQKMIKVDKEEIGFMKLGYFLHLPDHPGVMIVRRHADETVKEPILVFDVIKQPRGFELCQTCSNRQVFFKLCAGNTDFL